MRRVFRGLVGVALAVLLTFNSCVKDEVPPGPLTLVSLGSGPVNLSGEVGVEGVDVLTNIVAVFSTNLDPATIDSNSVTLRRGTFRTQLNFVISGNTLTIDPAGTLLSGANLTLLINNSVRSSKGDAFEGKSFTFKTAGVGIDTPAHSETQTLYVTFNASIFDVVGNATKVSEQLLYTTDRFGIANQAAYFRNTATGGSGDLAELSGVKITPSMTLSVWLSIDETSYGDLPRSVLGLAADHGFYMQIGNKGIGTRPNSITFATEHLVNPGSENLVYRNEASTYTADNTTNDTIPFSSARPVDQLLKEGWHQFVMTFDAASSLKTFYVDGIKIQQWSLKALKEGVTLKDIAINPGTTLGLDTKLAIGYACSKANTTSSGFNYETDLSTYNGVLDDLRIFDNALTPEEVSSLYTAEKAID